MNTQDSNTWMVRAGEGGRFFDDFKDKKIVALGWPDLGNPGNFATRDDLLREVKNTYSDYTPQGAAMAASQIWRFVHEMRPMDRVVTYDPRARSYLCGVIEGDFIHSQSEPNGDLINQRSVRWQHERSRDALSSEARYALGGLTALFAIQEKAVVELWSTAAQAPLDAQTVSIDEIEENKTGAELLVADAKQIADLSQEKIKDKIARLSPYEMQDLVAGLLRAMGYVTAVSLPGPDRGRDIVASPDGFGFQEPRIVVEVKHRAVRIGAPDIRAFIGGRRPHEKCLYVSTGGFTQEAYYEAERSALPLTLLDFEQLIESVLMHYSKFDENTRRLIPLATVYWPL